MRRCGAAAGRVRASLAAAAAVLGIAAAGIGGVESQTRAPSSRGTEPPYLAPPTWYGPLEHPPLDPPLRLSGSFGEYRTGHFHAGVDLSTDEQPGRPVYASLTGDVVRVRSSGVGYGRSVYLQAPDGRLLVYGHLDAFDEPLASYVDSVQRATGQYEQDLWPDSTRFRVTAGKRLGWSGRSGTGPPHLHFEIRRGDMAYNPLFAGLAVRDSAPPVLRRVTVEPLPGSAIRGRAGAQTLELEGYGDSLHLFGSARVAVEAVDGRANGQLTMAPWRVWMLTPDGHTVECRFDSASWADGMSEVDEVYDRGRTAPDGAHAIRLWSPARHRPRPIHADLPDSIVAGIVRADPAAGRQRISFETRDLTTFRITRPLWLVPWDPPAAVRDSLAAPGAMWARIRAACTRGGAALLDRERAAFHAVTLTPDRPLRETAGSWTLDVPTNAAFEPEEAAVAALPAPAASGELHPAGVSCALLSDRTALRVPFTLRWNPARGRGAKPAIYREGEDGWEWVGARIDSASGAIVAESRRAGHFAPFEDMRAPKITLHVPARRAPAAPYPRWTLEATLEDPGSGVAARASAFLVDGVRVPSEWDPEVSTLRWTPLRPPRAGRHRVEVIAADRAGNIARAHGSFVLDSAR